MAILEINLEKPALVEEYQYAGETGSRRSKSDESSESSRSSGGGAAKLVGLLAVLAGVGLLAWKLKNRGTTKQSHVQDFEGERGQSQRYEHGPEPEIGADESGGAKRKVASVLGLTVTLISVVAAVRKARR